MSDCPRANNGADNVRKLPRALSRASQQDKARRFYSRYAKVWRADVLWTAWRQVKAHKGAPGGEGQAIEAMIITHQEEAMISPWQEALRERRSQCAPVRLVAIPQPQGGTRPLGMATGKDRVVQTAMQLVREPLDAADFHDCSYGDRPQRDAQHASTAMRPDLDHRAWGGVESDCQAYFTSLPHRKRMRLITKRIADGSLVKRIKQTLKGGVRAKGQGVPTKGGVPHGSPLSPWSSTLYLNRLDQLWPSRGYPEKLGAPRHRYADDAMLVCRRRPQPVLAAFAALATRMALTLNRDKTHVTRVTEGCDVIGFTFVKRQSPRSGKNTISMVPAKSAPQTMRHRLQYLTSRRAPIGPQAGVEMVHPIVTGWANSCRQTNASQAFRGLQCFVNIRCRRYLPQRRKGRGFGWKRFPHSKLYAMGLAYIGSGRLEYRAKPAHGVRGRLSDRRTREN
jgi:group II intron reverse transcriptase/maturase